MCGPSTENAPGREPSVDVSEVVPTVATVVDSSRSDEGSILFTLLLLSSFSSSLVFFPGMFLCAIIAASKICCIVVSSSTSSIASLLAAVSFLLLLVLLLSCHGCVVSHVVSAALSVCSASSWTSLSEVVFFLPKSFLNKFVAAFLRLILTEASMFISVLQGQAERLGVRTAGASKFQLSSRTPGSKVAPKKALLGVPVDT
jgi:hypothetical protein